MDNVDLQTLLGLFVRHGLTTLGGILAAHGYLGSSTTEQFVAAGMVIVGVAWSWWQKRGQGLVAAELEKLKARATASSIQQAMDKRMATQNK